MTEKILPYRYQVYLDNEEIDVDFAPSHQSAVYSLTFEKEDRLIWYLTAVTDSYK